ncbi:MAG: zinc ribbon domain-containing protein [Planctomycetota bacterium]
MHPDVQKLLEVQKVDQQIARIQRDLDSIPAERARRQTALDGVRKKVEDARDKMKAAEVAARSSETAIKGSDEEIKKLETRLNGVRNNAEYQATLLQIESVKKERSRLEEEGLGLLDTIETLRGEVDRLAATLKDEEATFAEFEKKGNALLEQRRADLARVSVGRDDLVAKVPRDLLTRYERYFSARDSSAVCAVEGNTCTGCYTTIPPNLLVKLQSASAVVTCNSCQRILYIAN